MLGVGEGLRAQWRDRLERAAGNAATAGGVHGFGEGVLRTEFTRVRAGKDVAVTADQYGRPEFATEPGTNYRILPK